MDGKSLQNFYREFVHTLSETEKAFTGRVESVFVLSQ